MPCLLSLLFLLGVMEGCKEPEDGGRGRYGTMMLLLPPSFLLPALPAGESLYFDPAEDLQKPSSLWRILISSTESPPQG